MVPLFCAANSPLRVRSLYFGGSECWKISKSPHTRIRMLRGSLCEGEIPDTGLPILLEGYLGRHGTWRDTGGKRGIVKRSCIRDRERVESKVEVPQVFLSPSTMLTFWMGRDKCPQIWQMQSVVSGEKAWFWKRDLPGF